MEPLSPHCHFFVPLLNISLSLPLNIFLLPLKMSAICLLETLCSRLNYSCFFFLPLQRDCGSMPLSFLMGGVHFPNLLDPVSCFGQCDKCAKKKLSIWLCIYASLPSIMRRTCARQGSLRLGPRTWNRSKLTAGRTPQQIIQSHQHVKWMRKKYL